MNVSQLFRRRGSKNEQISARIVSKPTTTLCRVQDRRGRLFSAESDGTYRVGQYVLVRNGVVIGVTRKPKTVPHFNV